MTVHGSTLNFKKESAAFAKALQNEHSALGELLENLAVPAELRPVKAVAVPAGEGVPADGGAKDWPDQELVEKAKKAHEAVRFQRARTEAARGR